MFLLVDIEKHREEMLERSLIQRMASDDSYRDSKIGRARRTRERERERERETRGECGRFVGRGLVFVRSSTVLTITSGFAITTILCRILLLANLERDETQTP